MLAPHSFCLPDDTFRLPGSSIRAKHASYSCACDLGEMLMGSSEFCRTLQSRVTVQATATSKDCCIWFCFPSSYLNMVAGRSSLWILYHFLQPVNSWLPPKPFWSTCTAQYVENTGSRIEQCSNVTHRWMNMKPALAWLTNRRQITALEAKCQRRIPINPRQQSILTLLCKAFTLASLPNSFKSENDMTSAMIKPGNAANTCNNCQLSDSVAFVPICDRNKYAIVKKQPKTLNTNCGNRILLCSSGLITWPGQYLSWSLATCRVGKKKHVVSTFHVQLRLHLH